MEIVKSRKLEDPFGSVSEGILKDDVYIINFKVKFKDGYRIISVGIKHRCYIPTDKLTDEFEAVIAVVSPKDKYKVSVEKEIILGRLKKDKYLPIYIDSHGLKITRKFIETVAEIIAYSKLKELNKRYKQVYPKKS